MTAFHLCMYRMTNISLLGIYSIQLVETFFTLEWVVQLKIQLLYVSTTLVSLSLLVYSDKN